MDASMSLATRLVRFTGIILTIVGIAGLLVTTSQSGIATVAGMDVNLAHSLLHLVVGLLAVGVGFGVVRAVSTRDIALVVGAVFTAFGAYGLVVGDFDVLGLFQNVDQMGSVFHLVVGLLGVSAYVSSRNEAIETA